MTEAAPARAAGVFTRRGVTTEVAVLTEARWEPPVLLLRRSTDEQHPSLVMTAGDRKRIVACDAGCPLGGRGGGDGDADVGGGGRVDADDQQRQQQQQQQDQRANSLLLLEASELRRIKKARAGSRHRNFRTVQLVHREQQQRPRNGAGVKRCSDRQQHVQQSQREGDAGELHRSEVDVGLESVTGGGEGLAAEEAAPAAELETAQGARRAGRRPLSTAQVEECELTSTADSNRPARTSGDIPPAGQPRRASTKAKRERPGPSLECEEEGQREQQQQQEEEEDEEEDEDQPQQQQHQQRRRRRSRGGSADEEDKSDGGRGEEETERLAEREVEWGELAGARWPRVNSGSPSSPSSRGGSMSVRMQELELQTVEEEEEEEQDKESGGAAPARKSGQRHEEHGGGRPEEGRGEEKAAQGKGEEQSIRRSSFSILKKTTSFLQEEEDALYSSESAHHEVSAWLHGTEDWWTC